MTQTWPPAVSWWKFTSTVFATTEASTSRLYVFFNTDGVGEWLEPVLDFEPEGHC